MHPNFGWRTASDPDSLPSYSRKYANYLRSTDFSRGLGLTENPTFFTPSYLRNSRYISRRDAAHRGKITTGRDFAAAVSAAANPPLSASPSNVHLPRMAPSHRGMTYEIIEKEPPTTADQFMPLPSGWSAVDRHTGLELSDEYMGVRYTGPVHKHDHEAAALRANHPMPPQCGIYYFEIKIESKPKEGYVVTHSGEQGIYTDIELAG